MHRLCTAGAQIWYTNSEGGLPNEQADIHQQTKSEWTHRSCARGLLFLMAILAQTLFAFVGSDLMTLTFLSAGHVKCFGGLE